MMGFHWPELIIVLVVALLIFGPKKLPEMGSAIGKSIKEFQKGMKEVVQPKEDTNATPEAIEAPSTTPVSSFETTNAENSAREEATAQHPND
jgi:TatA/E family protein of Tat protein translocase